MRGASPSLHKVPLVPLSPAKSATQLCKKCSKSDFSRFIRSDRIPGMFPVSSQRHFFGCFSVVMFLQPVSCAFFVLRFWVILDTVFSFRTQMLGSFTDYTPGAWTTPHQSPSPPNHTRASGKTTIFLSLPSSRSSTVDYVRVLVSS